MSEPIPADKEEAEDELSRLRKRNAFLEAREAERAHLDKLREASEARFEALFSGLHVGVVVQGPSTEILLINARACELLGVTEEQIRGKSSFDPRWNIIRENGRPFPAEERPVARVLATKQAVHDVVIGVYRPLNNDRAWLLVAAVPQFETEAGGELVQVVATFTDITELKKAEARVLEQQQLIAEISTPLVPLGNEIVLMPLVGTLASWRIRQATEVLLRGIVDKKAKVALVDIAGAESVDREAVRGLIGLAQTSRWLGARVIFTGLRPETARILAWMDEDMSSIATKGTLQAGFNYARQLVGRGDSGLGR